MATIIYKIAERDVWETARRDGALLGTAVDLADGYIHLSTAAQLAQTLDKHYRGRADLVLVQIDAEALGLDLKWEPSRGGDLFPHLYGPLPMDKVIAERNLASRPDDGFDLPELDL